MSSRNRSRTIWRWRSCLWRNRRSWRSSRIRQGRSSSAWATTMSVRGTSFRRTRELMEIFVQARLADNTRPICKKPKTSRSPSANPSHQIGSTRATSRTSLAISPCHRSARTCPPWGADVTQIWNLHTKSLSERIKNKSEKYLFIQNLIIVILIIIYQ